MTEAQGPFFQQGDTGKPTSATAVTAFAYTNKTVFDDIVRRLQNQHRSWLWYKGLNADLLDSLHAAYLTTAVNEDDVDHPDLNDTLPAAPSGGLNVKWQAQATQNSDSQTPVSAYVPFSSLSIVTAVAADYVVITDTSDSANPKRALVSDITALVAPTDAQYVTLATNGTLTNERVLTPGTAIDITDAGAGSTVTIDVDLNELGVGTPAAADTFVFIDADDSVAKKGSAAATLTAIGGASATTALTAAAVLADKAVVVGAAADRTTVKSDFTMTHDGTNVVGLAAGSTISFGANALSTTGTAATGAQTITQATVGTVFRTEVSTATNDDPTEKFYHGRGTTTEDGLINLFSFTPAADKRYTIEATVNVRQTAGAGTGTGRTIKIIADVQDIGGTVTVTIVSNTSGGTLAVTSCTVAVTGAVTLDCQVEGIAGSGKTYVHHAKIALFGPVGT